MSKSANRTTDFTDADLEALPNPQRSLLSTLINERCSYKHLAVIHSMPIGTVKSRISRARKKIAQLRGQQAA